MFTIQYKSRYSYSRMHRRYLLSKRFACGNEKVLISDISKRKLPLLLLLAAAAAAAATEDAGGGDLDAGGGGDFSLGMVNTAALGFNCRHQD